MNTSVWIVFVAALGTALATGLGAVPFFFVHSFSRRWLGLANALAAGLMLGASTTLIYEGGREGVLRLSCGIVLGVILIALTQRLIQHDVVDHVGSLQGAAARKALMIVGVMTIHSFTEGIGIGVSYGGGEALGVFITVAIAVHNIPEGLAISLVLVPRGTRVVTAAAWSIFSSLPQPLMAIPAFVFVDFFRAVLPVGLGFAAGAMLWMVVRQLVPDAVRDASTPAVASTVAAGVGVMVLLQVIVLSS